MREPAAGQPQPEEPLSGGNMTDVVRVGDTVRRAAGPWTPAVHRLLDRLHERGIAWAPRAHGLDARGREILDHLPGTPLAYPMPAWVWTDELLLDAAGKLRELHDATAGMSLPDAVWQLPAHEPPEVICHNDFAPYNFVCDDAHRIAGVIDWDTAAPGPRVWDLAYLAYRLCPLTAPENPDGRPGDSVREQSRRLALLLAAYGGGVERAELVDTVVRRLEELAAFTSERASATGRADLREHVALYRRDAGHVRSIRSELVLPPR